MTESQRLKEINKRIKRMRRLGEEYDVAPPAAATTVPVTPVTPKKKKKGTIRRVIGTIKGFLRPKRKKGITPPSGYAGMTPAQKKEWQSIMEQTK